ncbi:hypothetical protein ESB00_05110 [Oleiharenicola lentus]|uniref:Uncharacterized protein n=1 Tax=Oleiharenicola lentus TaxID=2508720 RepID=A0A4V1M6G1_9BACT|nr:hypothetical protein [Oleiharenicola lentus]RXK55279.1 hypothetical protein ESB00_05110 [Oleiharenicola lentus]
MSAASSLTANRVLRALCFAALAAGAFILPAMPSLGLDSAWQMALGRVFADDRAFGTEVVFTYGPLGWTMGNMYWGAQWGALVAWHAGLALILAALLTWQAFRLPPLHRVGFLLFFLTLGVRHEDILQQAAIALAGWELIRRSAGPWQRSSVALLALLALLSLVKFTNLVLAVALVALASAAPLARRDWRAAAKGPAWWAGLFLAGWLFCGQNPLHLPAYLWHSWEISSGYQDAMGWSCPSVQLYHGLATAALLVGLLGLRALADRDRGRGWALAAGAAAYLFLSWKHGFIRADGHQLVFYFAALAVVVSPLHLPGDALRWPWPRRLLLVATALLALRGAELATPGVAPATLATLKDRLQRQASLLLEPRTLRAQYDWTLDSLRAEVPLPLVRRVVGDRPIDVLGYEQDVLLLNRFNYAPRPVFQGYSAYTPRLARLNRDYFESERAPEFVLFKLQTVDDRLPSMDDPLVLDLLPQRYRYLFTERGFTLWQRKAAPAGPAASPAPVRSVTARLGEPVDLTDLGDRSVWVRIDYRLNLLGRVRRLLLKPPMMRLKVTDTTGAVSDHRLPAPIAATGFPLSPLVHDISEFLRAANGEPGRRVASFVLEPAPQDRDCFQPEVAVEISVTTTAPGTGWAALSLGSPELPLEFVRGTAPFGAQLSQVEGGLEYYAHAPSSLVYRAAAGATTLRGSFGLYDGAYAATNAGASDGAEFLVHWHAADGRSEMIFRRLLRPRDEPADRGPQDFAVPLPAGAGELEFAIGPGPAGNSASDWTYWRHLRLENSH